MKQILEQIVDMQQCSTGYCNKRITDLQGTVDSKEQSYCYKHLCYLLKVKQTCILSLGLDVTEGLPTGMILEEPHLKKIKKKKEKKTQLEVCNVTSNGSCGTVPKKQQNLPSSRERGQNLWNRSCRS